MATQTVNFPFLAGQTGLSLRLRSLTNGAIVATASSSESTANNGVQTAEFTDVAAGKYLIQLIDGSDILADDTVTLTLTTATFWVDSISGGAGGEALETTSQEILGIVEDIQTKVSSTTIATTGYAQVDSDGVLQLKEGHTATLTFTSSTSNIVSDLTSARVYLSIREPSGSKMLQVQGAVLVATGLQSVRFAIDAASAKKLRAGKHLFDVIAVYGYDESLTPPYTGLEPFTGGRADVTRLELIL